MDNIHLSAVGPYFILFPKDVEQIYQKRFIDIRNENLNARISLVEYDPNCIINRNGTFSVRDIFCQEDVRLRRYPEDISPLEFKGDQFYVLRVKRSLFDKLVEHSKDSSDRRGFIHPRCKYDRFTLIIDSFD